MSVSGLSPRPYAGSFSAGAATRPRAASPALGATASSYNSILLDECSIRPESHRLFYQAKKIKEARAKEELRAKLEEYKQQIEQLEVRAIAAEAEVTSLKFENSSLEGKIKHHEGTIDSLKRSSTAKEESLERFQQKLAQIRKAMTKEVDKLRRKEKDLKLAFDSVMRCVLEYRTDAISKDDFLSTVDLISSSLMDSGSYAPISGQLYQTVFSTSERERLSALPPGLRKTRLQELMGVVSDHDAGATTDEDLLKGAAETMLNESPPPLPPRTKSTSSMAPEELKKAEEMLLKDRQQQPTANGGAKSPRKQKPRVLPRKLSQLPLSTPEVHVGTAPQIDRSLKPSPVKPVKSPRRKRNHMNNSLRQMYSQDSASANRFSTFQGVKPTGGFPTAGFYPDSDSNSSDFEEFVPPQRRRNFVSESQSSFFMTPGPYHLPLDRRGSSPFPSSRPGSREVQAIKKSSPILTRRPTWFSRKMTSPALLESLESPSHTLPPPDRVQKREQSGHNSKSLRKKKARSRSLDSRANMSVSSSGNAYSLLDLHAVGFDSDEGTGGTVDSSGYSRPFEHINSWRKLIGMDDGSAFSGSLPRLTESVNNAMNSKDDDSDTYLDPREIAQKLDKSISIPEKVRKRIDTVVNNTYLQLISVQPPQFAEIPEGIKPPSVTPGATVGEASNSTSQAASREPSFKEKWENRSLDFIERPDSCLSGYSSDSSTWAADKSDQETEEGELDDGAANPYDEIKARRESAVANSSPFDDAQYSTSAPVKVGGEDVYSVIDEGLLSRRGTDASSEIGRKEEAGVTFSPPLPKPRIKKKSLSKQDSGIYAKLEDTLQELPLEVIKDESSDCRRPPTPPPRRHRNISMATKGSDCDEGHATSKRLNIPGIGTPPLYISLKRGEHVKLVPLSATTSPNISSDEHNLSDVEVTEHLYSLGKFVSAHNRRSSASSTQTDVSTHQAAAGGSPSSTSIPKRRITHSAATSNLLVSSTDHGYVVSAEDTPPPSGHSSPLPPPFSSSSGAPQTSGGGGGHKPLSPQRSNTMSAPQRPKSDIHRRMTNEKKGYLNKMGPENKKRYNRRWFVLSGSELRYYRSHKDLKRPRGIIKLESWCKLSRLKSQDAFELATPERTYQLAAKNAQECTDWLKALEEAMQFHTWVTKDDSPLKTQSPAIAGWAHVTKNGRSERLWCELDRDMLNLSARPGVEPTRRISVSQSSVRKKRDSILLDSNYSRSNLKAMLFSIKERESGGITTIAPDVPEDKEKWFYHLSTTQGGGDQLELTPTEKILAQIMQDQSVNPRDSPNWKHPVLNWTSGRLHQALTSLPSSALNTEAKNLFQHLQLFLSTPMKPLAFEHHLCSVQHLIDSCLKHPPLQDELYCQLLRQISGHTSMTSHHVLQGWFLLYLMIHMFLPLKVKFNWYLHIFLERHIASTNMTISNFALECSAAVKRAQQEGRRQCKPSYFELNHLLSRFSAAPTTLDAKLTLRVNLPDSTQQEVDLTPSTSVLDFTAKLNALINMPDTLMTGFSLMCDWPGVHEASCCCPFPESKVCDIISMWSSSLDELNYNTTSSHVQAKQQRRDIMFTYQRRLAFKKHQGLETDVEAILLSYQVSTNVLSGHHPVTSVENGLQMAAIMAQIEYGDWSNVEKTEDSEYTARDVLQRFCPWKFTHMALEHDQSQLQKGLVDKWKEMDGNSKAKCSKTYLELAQQWKYYGATLFKAEEIFCSDRPHRTIWMAVHEEGVSLLNSSTMGTISSYSYGEISTFGGSKDSEFIMVVSPRANEEEEAQRVVRGTLNRKTSGAGAVQTEKLVLTMPKLQVCEATFLIASYMEAYEGPKMNAYDI